MNLYSNDLEERLRRCKSEQEALDLLDQEIGHLLDAPKYVRMTRDKKTGSIDGYAYRVPPRSGYTQEQTAEYHRNYNREWMRRWRADPKNRKREGLRTKVPHGTITGEGKVPPNGRLRWDHEDILVALQMDNAGYTSAEIAVKLGRSQEAVARKLRNLRRAHRPPQPDGPGNPGR